MAGSGSKNINAKLNSFDRAKKWVQELQLQGNLDMVVALAGNKSDLLDARKVTKEEAEAYARQNSLFFMETSAKTAVNVNDIFQEIARRLLQLRPTQNPAGIGTVLVGHRPPERVASTQNLVVLRCYGCY